MSGERAWGASSYAARVPVSKKRKKKSAKPRPTPLRAPQRAAQPPRQVAGDAFAALFPARAELDALRAAHAATVADLFVAGLVEFAPQRADVELEDELCRRLGAHQRQFDELQADERTLDQYVPPDMFLRAVAEASARAVAAALDEAATVPDGWRPPWRVLTAVDAVIPVPEREVTAEAIKALRRHAKARLLPDTPADARMTASVRWARDAYGSRFGIVAPFSRPDGPDRWYLWDVDACGIAPLTVHSGYYATAAEAEAMWRAGVGPAAAGRAEFAPVDDVALLGELLPFAGGERFGGEDERQLAEYHRSRRLARVVIETAGPPGSRPPAVLDPAKAVREFTAWLSARGRATEDLEDQVVELADAWGGTDQPIALYGTCSPHHVAHTVSSLRDFFQADFADELIALLPEWITWLAERTGMAPELVERCRAYAQGEPYPGLDYDDPAGLNPFARVIE